MWVGRRTWVSFVSLWGSLNPISYGNLMGIILNSILVNMQVSFFFSSFVFHLLIIPTWIHISLLLMAYSIPLQMQTTLCRRGTWIINYFTLLGLVGKRSRYANNPRFESRGWRELQLQCLQSIWKWYNHIPTTSSSPTAASDSQNFGNLLWRHTNCLDDSQ